MRPWGVVVLTLALVAGCGDDDGGRGGGDDAGGGDESDAAPSGDDAGGGTDAAIGADADPCSSGDCGPSAEITYPIDGTYTGDQVLIAFAVGAGAARVECTVDTAPVECSPPTLPQTLAAGDHVVTVQAFDAADHGGPIDSVTWPVDAAPPVITGITTTPLGPGQVTVDVTVFDQSAITRIRCGLDGAARVACGSGTAGTITFSELSPGEHTVDVIAVDEWGHTGAAVAPSPVPGSHAVAPFAFTAGPGHLVLIGDDLAEPLQLPATGLDQLLIDTFSQAPAISFSRGLRVAVLDVNTSPGELDHLTDLLGNLNVGSIDLVGLGEVEGALAGRDLLVVPDQNGAFDPASAPAEAAALEPALRAFLDAGGVVALLDGTFVDPDDNLLPSATFRILDRRLLAIDDAQIVDACADIPCNLADPIAFDVGTSLCVSGAIGYTTPEPWVTFAFLDQGGIDLPLVLHRVFGAPSVGPVAMRTGDGTQSWGGDEVVFQDPAGAEVTTCTTLSNGSAVHEMSPGGSVSLASFDFERGSYGLTTAIAVEPLDHVRLAVPPVVDQSPLAITVDLQDLVNAASFRVVTGCGEVVSDAPGGIALSVGCFNPDGTFDLVAEGVDVNERVIGYSILTGVTDPGGGNLAMPDWLAPNRMASLTIGPLAGVDGADMSVWLSSNGIDYLEHGTPLEPTGAGDFYASPGPGSAPFSLLGQAERAWFLTPVSGLTPVSRRRVLGGLFDSLDVNLANVLLPRITAFDSSFAPDDRMTLRWLSSGSLDGVDGGQAMFAWSDVDGNQHRWTLIVPPGTSVTAPPPPASGAAVFWPTQVDDVTLLNARFDDASFAPTYRDYRQDVGGVVQPPPTAHTLRTTELVSPP